MIKEEFCKITNLYCIFSTSRSVYNFLNCDLFLYLQFILPSFAVIEDNNEILCIAEDSDKDTTPIGVLNVEPNNGFIFLFYTKSDLSKNHKKELQVFLEEVLDLDLVL